MTLELANKRIAFRKLHESGPFIIPNAHDAASAKVLQKVGYQAIASTSAGLASVIGETDLTVSKDQTLTYLKQLCRSCDLPVNADFESGFARHPEDVAENIREAIETGICGLSLEDRWGDELLDLELSVDRIKAARKMMDTIDPNLILVGRSEGFLVGQSNIDDTINRLQAYSAAGADVLYAPGVATQQDISALVKALAPKPVNVLLVAPQHDANDMFEIGVKRVSVGGFLAQASLKKFEILAERLKESGSLPDFAF